MSHTLLGLDTSAGDLVCTHVHLATNPEACRIATRSHRSVLDAAVVAKPDEKWGEVPCAFVEVREGASLSEDLLSAWSRERLAGFKVPKAFIFGALPKTSTGKVQKFLLRERLRPYSTLAAATPARGGAMSGGPAGRLAGFGSRTFGSRALSSTSAFASASTALASAASACASASIALSSAPSATAPSATAAAATSSSAAAAPPLVESLTCAAGVTTIKLLDGRRRNPLSTEAMRQLQLALDAAASSKATRAVVLCAAGPAFSSGHDLKEVRAAAAIADPAARDAALAAVFAQCEQLMKALRKVPVPVIAAVHGPAQAAGCQLVAACDIVVADKVHASFATPGVKIGLFCHTPAVSVVRSLGGGVSGARRAAKMLYTGEPVGADDAERMGLVHELAPEGEAGEAAARLALRLASYSTEVMRDGKAVLRETAAGDDIDAAWGTAAAAMVRAASAPDAVEGVDAFLGKRTPEWRA